MYTRCPECNTVFRVGRGQLEAADGEVRCGRCNGIFNALDALSEFQPERGMAPVTAPADEPFVTDEGLADTDDEALLEFSLPEDRWGEVFLDHELDDAGEAGDTSSGDDPTDPREHGRDDRTPPRPDGERPADRVPEPADAARMPDDGDRPDEARATGAVAGLTAGPGEGDAPAFGLLALEAPAARAGRRAVWIAASVALLAALTAQVVHLNRVAIAGLPWLGHFVERAYDRAGMSVEPKARATDYRIVTAAASTESRNDGLLRIRATVANVAGHALPYPLVRLTLKDRWGESVGDRLIEPGEYAIGDVAPDALLAPGETVSADIRVVDPGADSFGFELDVCLRDAQRGVVCASGSATR